MRREVKRVVVTPGVVRYRAVVRGEPCPEGTQLIREHYYLFLRWLAANPSLLDCGYSIPAKVAIRHDGASWVAEAEAEVDEPGAE